MVQLFWLSIELALLAGLVFWFFHRRTTWGGAPLGAFVGSLQFLQTILSAGLLVELPTGLLVSPGSVVLFPATLVAVLLIYYSDGVPGARGFIAGLVVASCALISLVWITQAQMRSAGSEVLTALPKAVFEEPTALLVLGTLVLAIDLLLLVSCYEFTGRFGGFPVWMRIPVALVLTLVFDAVAFSVILSGGLPSVELLRSQLLTKPVAGLVYGVLVIGYLRSLGGVEESTFRSGSFGILTFRERYEYLLNFTDEQALRHEKVIRDSENRQAAVFEASPIGLVVVDLVSDRIVEVNGALSSMVGLSTDELLKMKATDLAAFQNLDIEKLLEPGNTQEAVARPNGRGPMPIEIRTSRFLLNDVPHACFALEDVTVRRAAEEVLVEAKNRLADEVARQTTELEVANIELQGREEQYRSLVEASSDLIFSISEAGRLLVTNESWRQQLGYSSEQVSALTVRDLIHPDDWPAWVRNRTRTVSRPPAPFVGRLLRADGVAIDVEGEVSWGLEEQSGDLIGRCIVRNVSESKQLERARSHLLAVVSHELRTPLTSLRGALRLLAKSVESGRQEKVSTYVDLADRNASRLIWLVNDILNFQRLDADVISPELGMVHIDVVLRGAATEVQGMARHCEVGIDQEIEDGLMVVADDRWLHQAVVNLLSNAIKHTPSGEKVTLSASKDPLGRVEISVADRGPGMSDEAAENAFQPFGYVGATAGHGFSGSGLGLSIVKRIADKMNASIRFENDEDGAGCVFHLTMDAADAAASST